MTVRNVLGETMDECGCDPVTGFYRDGYCNTDPQDFGQHTICTVLTQEFLEFSKARGNDLMSPRPEFDFPGLKAGDSWCICAKRFEEAYKAGCAPHAILGSTHEKALEVVSLEMLRSSARDIQ